MGLLNRLRRMVARTGRDRRWISDDHVRTAHEDRVRQRLGSTQAQGATVVYSGGPRDGEVDTVDALPVVVGTGQEGGVYQRTDNRKTGMTVYVWQPLTPSEADAVVRGDLRANQGPEQ